jgi:hypothetical protein
VRGYPHQTARNQDTFFNDPLPGVTELQLDPATMGNDYALRLENSDYSYTVNLHAVFA